MPNHVRLVMRDIMDGLIESPDGTDLGRVADVEITVDNNGTSHLSALIVGPEALARRISPWLYRIAHRILRGRFDHRIPIDEVEEFGPAIVLRQSSGHYNLGDADAWVYQRILRFIPGSGRR